MSRRPATNRRSIAVLNAFRHHRGGHRHVHRRAHGTIEGAQRLSASQRWACATAVATSVTCVEVLNAFRHHRGGHTRADVGSGVCDRASAQRLSASQRWAYRRSARSAVASRGAQRLSASQRWASSRPSGDVLDRQVLNAFRHHRGGHRRAIGSTRHAIDVLNAFRHHRGGHRRHAAATDRRTCGAQRLSASQRWASRPSRSCSSATSLVLNAFRHHRGGHTRVSQVASRVVTGAQRLSASQRWASIEAAGVSRVGLRCAQRLSASQRWACSATWRDPRPIVVLNAFRHHRGGHARAQPSRSTHQLTCSTPFGITEVGIALDSRRSRACMTVLNAFRHHRGGHHRTASDDPAMP